MKKVVLWALIVVVVVALTGCDLIFFKTLEYNISGSSDSLSIRYQDDGGNLIDVTASSPWSTDFNLGSSERPFLAFIRVDNNGLPGQDVTVYIRLDNSTKKSGTAVAGSGALEMYAIIE